MKILAFGHRKFVGKDTAVNFLVSHLRQITRGKLIVKTGFATKLKAISYDLYSWAGLMDEDYYEIHPELKDTIIPILNKSPRRVWIDVGMFFRLIHIDTWTEATLNRKCDFLIIKDLRFPNEAEKILERGGKVYKIDNPRIAPTPDEADEPLANFQHWSDVIVNDSNLHHLNLVTIQTTQSYVGA